MADNKPIGYFGYYPGERPVYKNYGSSVAPLPDMSGLDTFAAMVNSVDNYLTYNLNVPKKLKEFYMDDLFGAFRTSVTVDSGKKKITEEQISRYGPEAFQNLSGVGVSINLNPKKWAEDPGKMIKQTFSNMVSGVFDLTDFENKTEAAVMTRLLSDETHRRSVDDLTSQGFRRLGESFDINQENALLKKIEENIYKNFKGELPAQNPFSLDTSDRAYDAAKIAFLNLQYKSNNFSGREGAYDTAIDKSANCMLQDITTQVAASRAMTFSQDQAIESRMRMDSIEYLERVNFDDEIRRLVSSGASDSAIQARIDSMASIANGALYDVDSNLLRDQADRMVFEIRRDKEANVIDTMRRQHAVEFADLDAARAFADKYSFGKDGKTDYTEWFSDDYQNALRENIAARGVNSLSVDAQLEHINTFYIQTELFNSFDSLDNALNDLNKSLNKRALGGDSGPLIAKNLDTLNAKFNEFSVGGKLDDLLDRLPAKKREQYVALLGEYRKDGPIFKGAEVSLGKGLTELSRNVTTINGVRTVDLSFGEAGRLRNRFNDIKSGGAFGTGLGGRDLFKRGAKNRILRDLSEDWYNYGEQAKVLGAMTQKGNSIFALFPLLEEERAQGFWDEFFRQMEKGTLFETFALDRVKSKFKYYTPAYWVEEGIKRSHLLGFNIDDSRITAGSFWDKRFSMKNGLAKASYANNFSISVGGMNLRMQGGKHLEFVTGMRDHLLADSGKFQFTDSQLRTLLSAKNGDQFHRYISSMGTGFDADRIQQLQDQFTSFRNFFEKHGKFIGLPDGAIDDPEFMFQAFKSIHGHGEYLEHIGVSSVSGLTTKFSGVLQRVHFKLNALQTFLNDRYGHLIRPFINIKGRITGRVLSSVALKQFVSRLVAKLTTTLGAAFGAGIGGFLVKAIEPAIRYVVSKVIDFGEKFAKSILKGDIAGFLNSIVGDISKMFNYVLRTAIFVFSIPLILFVITSIVFGTVLSGTSPVNPTQIGGGEYISGNLLPGATTASAYIPCAQETITPTDCFFAEGNRGSAGSYDPTGQTPTGGGRGHGSNNYWNIVGDACQYNIPTSPSGSPARGSSSTAAGNDVNYCFNETIKETHYGFAADYPPVGCGTIYFPNIAENWTIVQAGYATFGAMAVATGFNYNATTGDYDEAYKLILLHLAPGGVYETGTSGQNQYSLPGEKASELADWRIGNGNNTHLHVELLEWSDSQNDWVVRRPEEFVCKGTVFN